MNILYPGDLVVIAIPISSLSKDGEVLNKGIGDIHAFLEAGPGSINFHWVPIGARDSTPEVLFVVREHPKS